MGKNLTDLCHPSDQVATMRTLREVAPTSGRPTLGNGADEPLDERPGTVRLLFRAKINTNTGSHPSSKDAQEYIWVECPGRLDGVRGRKAVIVHVRRREVPRVSWSSINASDGIARDDVWVRVARDARGLILDASDSAARVLGRAPDALIGASLLELVVDDVRGARRDALRAALTAADSAEPADDVAKTAWCNLPVVVVDRRAAGMDAAVDEEGGGAAAEKENTDQGTGTGSGSAHASKLAVATFEIAVFPPKSSTSPIPGEAERRGPPHSMICRLRIQSKREVADANSTSAGGPKVQPQQPQQQPAFASGIGSGTILPSAFIPVHPFSYSYLSNTGPSASTSAHLSGSLTSVRAPNSNAVKVLRTGNATDVYCTMSSCADHTSAAAAGSASTTTTTSPPGAGMDSSWQYELSLLRNRNERLRADVGVMEKERKARRRHRRKMGSLSVGPAGARMMGGVISSGGGLGLGLGLSHQQWVLQQQHAHAHAREEESKGKASSTAGDGHNMFLPVEACSGLKRTRERAGFEVGVPPPPTWKPGGGTLGV